MNEMQEEYKKFAADFVLRFPEEERSKLSVLLDYLINSRTHGLMDSDIEGLI